MQQHQQQQQPSSPALKGREAEAQFREKVETRAKEWKGEKQVLGHVVKSNIHRPRALLNLSLKHLKDVSEKEESKSSMDVDLDHTAHNNNNEEDSATARAMLWKARKLMDVGYTYWLDEQYSNLSQLITENKHEEGNNNNVTAYSNLGVLMTLPKGRDLVARCLEYKRAPTGHPQNFITVQTVVENKMKHATSIILTPLQLLEMLPHLFTYLFVHPAGAKKGEDRLLYVCISYIIAIMDDFPNVNAAFLETISRPFIASVEAVMKVAQTTPVHTQNLKKMLGSRARAEVMHALLTKGGEICGSDSSPLSNEWKRQEEEFLNMLSLSIA